MLSIIHLKQIPRTPAGDEQLVAAVAYNDSLSIKCQRWLQTEALARPRVYEDIMRILSQQQLLSDSATPRQSRKPGPPRD